MTSADADERSSTHTVITKRRFAVVLFDGPGRRVRRVVSLFADPRTAELFAVEQGWSEFAVAPASIVTSLRE